MYFGVAICKQGTSLYKYMTESTTISSGGGGGIDIPISSELGTYDVVYFLAETPKTSFTSPDISNTFIPIPNAIQTVLIKNSPITVSFTAVWDAGKTNYQLFIDNETNNQIQLLNCFIEIKYGDNPRPSASQVGEVTISLGTVTALANTTTTISNNVFSLPDYDLRGGLIYFISSNSAYNVSDSIGSID